MESGTGQYSEQDGGRSFCHGFKCLQPLPEYFHGIIVAELAEDVFSAPERS